MSKGPGLTPCPPLPAPLPALAHCAAPIMLWCSCCAKLAYCGGMNAAHEFCAAAGGEEG